ncbi:hypothetical protein FRC0316_00552 [Corynebacterium diphtheriae]|nr:hypothetical protein FRC0294_00487 [Corynebacterium diphtheriae]CAB0835398.1 hypothetical protein FRC0316_00552 [Corynebacterium diphtheriae]CAB0985693.1 hypothetical protein FRC0497_00531 [Corynebacterium diphtheriae]
MGSSVVVGVSSVVSEGVELGLLLGTGMVLSAELEGMEGSTLSEGIVDSFQTGAAGSVGIGVCVGANHPALLFSPPDKVIDPSARKPSRQMIKMLVDGRTRPPKDNNP